MKTISGLSRLCFFPLLSLVLSLLTLVAGIDLQWKQFCNEGDPPPGAIGSTLVGLDDKLYSFAGGQECPSKIIQGNTTVCTPNVFFNHVYVCDLDTNQWSLFETFGLQGQKPESRSFHKCVMHRDTRTMYCYGGTRYQNFLGFSFESFGDFWKLNIQTRVWTQINDTAPGIRVDPGMTIDDDNADIYLGFGVSGLFPQIPEEITRNDLWRYHIPTRTWELLSPNDPYHNLTTDVKPNVRYQCRMDFSRRHRKILVYGGDVLPDNRRTLCDLWSWDISDEEWEMLDNCSVPPLFTGASATYRDNYFILTGEDRGGRYISCADADNGKNNSPTNDQYVIDITRKGSSFSQIRPSIDIVNIMQSGYTFHRGKVYIGLGLEFFCIKDNLQGGSGRRAIQKYPTIVWGTSLPGSLD